MTDESIKAAKAEVVEIFRKTNPPKPYPYNELAVRAFAYGIDAGVKIASEQTADLRERLEAEESRADHYYKLHLGEHCFEDCLYCTEDYL